MAGKSWESSQKSLHSKRNWHLSQCWNSGKREQAEKGRGRETAWAMSCQYKIARKMPPVHVHVCMPRYDPWAHGITTHAHTCMCQHYWLQGGMQALFVVNSVKLHLTALKSMWLYIYCIPHFFVDIPQLAEELFVNSSVKLKVQDKQSKKTNKFLSLINFMGFTWD